MQVGQSKTVELLSIRQTGMEMGRIAIQYHADLAPWATWSLSDLCEMIRGHQYRPDPPDREHLSRPIYTLNGWVEYFDCDDRAICVGAWAECRGWPFRFVAAGRPWSDEVHHVYAEVLPPGMDWIYADCTYPHHRVGSPEFWELRQEIFDSRRDRRTTWSV
jgi:hypothetical protein